MGCDIHAHLEVKLEDWTYIGSLDINRNYDVFTFLANVRGKIACPLAEGRGVPDDVSQPVQMMYNYWGPDGHSHSWIDGEELETLIGYIMEGRGFALYHLGFHLEGCFDDKEIRMVFWFDN